jgi:DNA-binding Lrp family transcriptional regulator
MVNLDSKDFKILYELFLNSRQSSFSISKKTNINHSVVKYRIKKLEKEKIIQDYCIIPNFKKIGYHLCRLYISLQFAPPGKEMEIINFFQQKKNTWRIESSQGKYDIILTIIIKNIKELFSFFIGIMNKYSNYFKKISFSQSIEMFGFKPQLILKENSRESDKIFQFNDSKVNDLDSQNKKIIYFLNKNARIPLIKIAKNLKISVPTVISYINNLNDNNIIKNYSIIIDNERIGFKRFILRLSFIDYKKTDSIIRYFSLNSNILEIYKIIGDYHLEIVLLTNTLEHFHSIIEDFRTKYSNDIKDYEYIIINKVHTISSQSDIFK